MTPTRARLLALALFGTVAAATPPAYAYDAATTHAGLTEQAVIASHLHHVLGRRLARPLGLFDPIALHPEVLGIDERRGLVTRLGALDPAGGYRPAGVGVGSARGWRVGGAPLLRIGFYPRGSRVRPAQGQCRAMRPVAPPPSRCQRRWPGPRRRGE